MALHQYNPPDLRNHETLLDDFFDFLQDSLGQHTLGHEYVRYNQNMVPHYHAHGNVLTQGPQRGRPLIEWTCPYCHQIHTYTQYFNHQRNQVRLVCHNSQPDYIPNRPGDDKARIDPLQLPFEPIPPKVMARVLHALALSQPIQPIPTSPSLPTPEQPSEETQPTNNQPILLKIMLHPHHWSLNQQKHYLMEIHMTQLREGHEPNILLNPNI